MRDWFKSLITSGKKLFLNSLDVEDVQQGSHMFWVMPGCYFATFRKPMPSAETSQHQVEPFLQSVNGKFSLLATQYVSQASAPPLTNTSLVIMMDKQVSGS